MTLVKVIVSLYVNGNNVPADTLFEVFGTNKTVYQNGNWDVDFLVFVDGRWCWLSANYFVPAN